MGIVSVISLITLVIGVIKKNKKIVIVSGVLLILSVIATVNFIMGLDSMHM